MGIERAVLIADDEVGVRQILALTLKALDLQVLEAADGAHALELGRDHRPKLALLDISMPGSSGIEVCRALKADPATAEIKVVILTAHAQERYREEALQAGADAFLTKPFSPRALLDMVDRLLAPNTGQNEIAGPTAMTTRVPAIRPLAA